MAGEIKVRMYNVGLGDCFLLLIPGPEDDPRTRKVLIDCGEHFEARAPLTLRKVVERLIADLKEGEPDGVARVDVVVATHRHQDHVSGFRYDVWQDVDVGEVWMPWTEKPNDRKAQYIRALQTSANEQIVKRLIKQETKPNPATIAEALNALKNADAMETLHGGFASGATLRFMPERGPKGESVAERRRRLTFAVPNIPGLTVSVLGPSHDPAVIEHMHPPSGESYLRLRLRSGAAAPLGEDEEGEDAAGLPDDEDLEEIEARLRTQLMALYEEAKEDTGSRERPERAEAPPTTPLFGPEWRIAADEYPATEGRRGGWLSQADRAEIGRFDAEDAMATVAELAEAVNGTSLMLMFRMGDAYLLFPGDAQWGPWEVALREWRTLLKKTTFLKVGHHASHNATPKQFVEEVLGENRLAMVSTRSGAFESIPRKPLVRALRERPTRVVLSNKPAGAGWGPAALPAGFTRPNDYYVEATVPT